VHPHKNLKKNQLQYSRYVGMKTSSEYAQYPSPNKKIVQSSRRIPKRATPQRVMLQRRYNAEELSYSTSCPYQLSLSLESPLSPKYDSDLSTDIPTLKNKNESDITTLHPEVKSEVIPKSTIELSTAEFNVNKTPYKLSTVKVQYADFCSYQTRIGKNAYTATFK